MLAIGNGELKILLGDTVKCRCGEEHPIQESRGKDSHGNDIDTVMQWYRCGDKSYMAGLNGLALPGVES